MSRALDRGQQPIAPGALGTGTPGSGNFLRGDGVWEAVPTPTIASTAEAEAGTNNTNFMTPLRTADQRIATALGWGQTLQNVLASRSAGVTYTNTTGRPIWVSVGELSFTGRTLTVDGLLVSANSGNSSNAQAIVPPGSTYLVNFSVAYWVELR
jgi:hypothetical protein